MSKINSKNINRFFRLVIIFCSIPVLGAVYSFAQMEDEVYPPTPTRVVIKAPTKATGAGETAKKKPDLPKSGLLSSTTSTGYQNKGFAMPWGGTDQGGKEVPPITGSISRASPKEWLVKIHNNSEASYSVSLRVSQYNLRGVRVKTDSFSYTLRPKQGNERRLTKAAGAEDAQLSLENWKLLEKAKT